MYRPKLIEARDFQSFESLSYNFKAGESILIEGENLTDDGQKTNGSGKSSFVEIIYYSLLGVSSTGKRDVKLIRWGQKSAFIAIELENLYLNHTLRIERTLYANSKPSELEIYINGESQKSRFASVADGNKLILDILDISADDIKSFYLVNRNRFVSFFESPDSAKRTLLARFSNVDRVQQNVAKIDEIISSYERQVGEKEVWKNSIVSKLDLLEEQLSAKLSENFYEETKNRLSNEIESCKDRISSIDREIAEKRLKNAEYDKEIAELDKQLESLNEKISKLQEKDFEKELSKIDEQRSVLLDEVAKKRQEKEWVESECSELNKSLQPILLKLKGLIVCPKCHHEFTLADKDFNATNAREVVSETENVIKDLSREIEELNKEILAMKNSEEMSRLELQRNEVVRQRAERDSQVSNIKNFEIRPVLNTVSSKKRDADNFRMQEIRLMSEKESVCESLSRKETELKGLSVEIKNPDIAGIEATQKTYTESLAKLDTELEQLTSTLQQKKLWRERISQFYVYLTNKTLSVIQNRCNLFLHDIKSDLEIQLDGFKILANGTIRENVSASITRNGLEPEDFKCFSGGERGRAIFSTILTFQQMINEKSKSGGLDFCCIDEVLDTVDARGMGLFIKSLKGLDRTIFIVSQVKTDIPVENVLTISKVNGVSSILEN